MWMEMWYTKKNLRDKLLHFIPNNFEMKNKLKSILSVLAFLFACLVIPDKTNAEDGYELWLRYKKVENPALIEQYSVHLKNVVIVDDSPTFTVVKKRT